MQESAQKRVANYQRNVEDLFAKIRVWLEGTGWSVQEKEIEIAEPRPGAYSVPLLTVLDQKSEALAELRPMGAWIIGADGRVDLCGHLEKEVLVYWEKGAPEINLSVALGKDAASARGPLFKGADRGGWYWIEDKMRAKAIPLDKELFTELVMEVQPL